MPTFARMINEGPQLEDNILEEAQEVAHKLLKRDVRQAVKEIIDKGADGLPEMRYLVRLYYQHQKFRIHSANVIRRYYAQGKSYTLINWAYRRDDDMEKTIASALAEYAKEESTGMGAWAMQAVGIGPVIATGLLANIDKRKRTVSALWSFAGLNPEMPKKWGSLGKRPFNADLKLLAFHIGHSFMMVHNRPKAFYGQIYAKEKARQIERNLRGDNATLAAETLKTKNFSEDTVTRKALMAGRLSDGQIEQRAERYAAKMFLCHWLVEAHHRWFNEDPPRPWITSEHAERAGLGGHHYIPAPDNMRGE